MIVGKYDWYYMPASVHLVLLHGADYMLYFPVPLGMLSGTENSMLPFNVFYLFFTPPLMELTFSEEALESRHKDLRFLRLHHTRKSSRKFSMEDLFLGLMSRSDPLVALYRQAPKPKSVLEMEVMNLLLLPQKQVDSQLRLWSHFWRKRVMMKKRMKGL